MRRGRLRQGPWRGPAVGRPWPRRAAHSCIPGRSPGIAHAKVGGSLQRWECVARILSPSPSTPPLTQRTHRSLKRDILTVLKTCFGTRCSPRSENASGGSIRLDLEGHNRTGTRCPDRAAVSQRGLANPREVIALTAGPAPQVFDPVANPASARARAAARGSSSGGRRPPGRDSRVERAIRSGVAGNVLSRPPSRRSPRIREWRGVAPRRPCRASPASDPSMHHKTSISGSSLTEGLSDQYASAVGRLGSQSGPDPLPLLSEQGDERRDTSSLLAIRQPTRKCAPGACAGGRNPGRRMAFSFDR